MQRQWLKMARRVGTSILVIALAVQAYLLRGSRFTNVTTFAPTVQTTKVPTLLIPGWGGNTWTYQRFIDYAARHHYAQHTMTIWVAPSGKVTVKGHVQGVKNPLIQLLYTWNYTPTYQGQVKQLTRVLLLLARDYQVHDLNVVAHSYGGTKWLHAYIANPQLQRQLNFHRVILLGVPTDESFGAKTKYTQTLFKRSVDPEFLKLTHQIQTAHLGSDDHLYNWMGQTQPGTDGEVPIVQSEMLRSLIKNKHVHYHQRIFPATNHIQLHQKPTILRQICQVLWGKGNG